MQIAIVCIPDKINFKITHSFDKELYKKRNVVERFFARGKEVRTKNWTPKGVSYEIYERGKGKSVKIV